ncbi:LysR substrate-binding domain-containing protein [Ideonella sp. A 288]|uniref:LysR substrate-binding domain-containing protein n=1 Tax=Ideonella sp. A 288 TaxID=1962181 RepID=UPI000B4AC994|nr:LysR substrate-binding domain-containing protein [Ideonella sp. A 288]
MLLDLEQLRTLVAFADAGSCRGAAHLVHKTPSAVSMHLSKLGQQLDRDLLQRQGRRLALTHDGNELVRYARRMLALQAEALAHFQAPEFGGNLRVGLPDDYIAALMGPLLATLARLAPQAHIEVLCAPSAELRPLVADGQLDLAILSAETDTQEGMVLRTERVVWTASAHFDATSTDCLPLALFPDGCIFRKWALAQLRQRRREHRIVCTSRSMSAIQAAVRAGFAVSVVAESCVPADAVVLTPSQGFAALPGVTIILAASPSTDAALVQRLSEQMRGPMQRLTSL